MSEKTDTAGPGRSGEDETTRHSTVEHGDATIALTRGGRGTPLVLCPGLFGTQAELGELTRALRGDFDVTAFDLRGHGRSFPAERYRFSSFLGDLEAVMSELERTAFASPPLLVGHSLGADLIVHYAAEHPGAAAGLVLVDGANPLPEPLITPADLAEFRAMAEEVRRAFAPLRGTERQVLLTAEDVVELNLEVDASRQRLIERFRRLDLPISVIASTAMAGRGDDERTRWRNERWRAGFERLVRERPRTAVTWIDAGHDLVSTHADRIAEIIRRTWGPAAEPPPDRPRSGTLDRC